MPPYNFVSNIRYLFNPKKALYNHPWVTVSCYLGK